MKKAVARFLSCFRYADTWFFLVATVFLLVFASLEVRLHVFPFPYTSSVVVRISLLLMICLLFYLAGMLYVDRTGNRALFPRLFLFFFLIYLYLLLNVTLFEKGFGRDTLVSTAEDTRKYYLAHFVNPIPFRSIYKVYILGLANGYVAPYYVLLNLLGNLCVFMPYAFFLPAAFVSQRKWYVFLPTLVLSVTAIELLQFFFMVGSCDVDDLILNTTGALLLYFLLRVRALRTVCERLFGKK